MDGLTGRDFLTPGRDDDPRREILAGALLAGAFFVGLVGWSAFARMDEAAFAPGMVVVSGHRQSVQAPDGGVISALDVREGDKVTAGQLLVEFAPAVEGANERALTARVLQLKAELARLDAEELGRSTIVWPVEFSQLDAKDRPLAEQAMQIETRTLAVDNGASSAKRGALQQRIAQAGQQQLGYQRQLAANQAQQQLNVEELKGVRDLAAQGYAPQTRVRALEQSGAGLQGEAGAQLAAIAQLKASQAETRMQIGQADSERAQQLAEERRRTQDALEQLEPDLQTARAKLQRTQLRAPTSGSVVGLAINTIGGVVQPGQHLMEIVPSQRPLVVEAQISPRDAGDVKVGQRGDVRQAPSADGQAHVLHGVVSRLSPDAVVDERTGQTYFVADVAISQAELDRFKGREDQEAEFHPGAPVEVILPLRKRTALQYWTEPLFQSLWRSLHER
jgi:HlyD family secretion protein